MPVFAARLRMTDSALLGDQDYSFNFHVLENGTSDQAWEDANEIAEAMVGTILPPNVTIYEVSIRNKNVVNGVQNRPVSLVGTRTVSGDALPGWNVAEMQSQSGIGSRKLTNFLRMGLTENDVNGQLLTSTTQGTIDAFRNLWLSQGTVSTKQGALITIAGFGDHVKMRQLGWHRRTRVGFHRGWVPNA